MLEDLSIELVETEKQCRVLVANLKGRFDAFSSIATRERLDQSLDEGIVNFIINLSETVFLDSAGMAVLVSLLNRARRIEGDVKLTWPKDQTAHLILNLARFDRVFEITDSVEVALQSFEKRCV